MKYAEARASLTKCGTLLSYYHQATKMQQAGIFHMASEGMCDGACKEWLRLVLHGNNGNAGPDALRAVQTQHLVENIATMEHFRTQRLDQLRQQSQQFKNALNELQDKGDSAKEQLAKWRMYRDAGKVTQGQYAAAEQQVLALMAEEKKKLTDRFSEQQRGNFKKLLIEGRDTPQHGRSQENMLYKESSRDFAGWLDRQLGLATHTHSGLTVTKLSLIKDYNPPNGLLTLMNKVMAEDKALQANCGVLLGLHPPDHSTGHAVAIHRLSSGKYHFFDPNYGVYEMVEARMVIVAVRFLFERVYGYCEDVQDDNHRFVVNGKVAAAYTVYQGPRPTARCANPLPSMAANTMFVR